MITGSSRGAGGWKLARHLLRSDENERVVVMGGRHLAANDLAGQIAELRAQSASGRSRRPLYHMHAVPPPGHKVTSAEIANFWRRFEEEFGLSDQPFAEVWHVKKGRPHAHRVYSLVLPTGRTADMSHDYIRRARVATEWAYDHGKPMPKIKHERALLKWFDRHRPEVAAAMRCVGADGLGPLRVAERTAKDRVTEQRSSIPLIEVRKLSWTCWCQSDTAAAFEAALAANGYRLAQGEKALVLVDPSGTVHRLSGALSAGAKAAGAKPPRAKEIRARLSALPLSTIEEARAALRRPLDVPRLAAHEEVGVQDRDERKEPASSDADRAANAHRTSQEQQRRRRARANGTFRADPFDGQLYKLILFEERWRTSLPSELKELLAYIDTEQGRVRLRDGSTIHDEGAAISTTRCSDPAITVMVAAARGKGWKSVRIEGDAAFKRAAVRALLHSGITVTNPELQSLIAAERVVQVTALQDELMALYQRQIALEAEVTALQERVQRLRRRARAGIPADIAAADRAEQMLRDLQRRQLEVMERVLGARSALNIWSSMNTAVAEAEINPEPFRF